ncbi:DUF5412 domain-containing protein [Lysinibacillus xylanilyticus]|uniref:DUF5412 domain-containing protein n=1 Tax=Lysinibacillus xylanilyticus TaxID=582475 RepID=A0A2M9QBX1_9BACI|nr:DUF5412 domain-containing protein [Lysinibacillus xylanilyticus]PJO45563.1 hypothetical protein CWD94_00455 [Lysinibacillus xylanilyticus]
MNDAEKLEIKKVYKKTLLVILISILFFAGIIGYGIYWLFFDWTRFKQELIAESTSPQGTYTVKAYVSDAGATTSFSVLGELVFNHEKRKSKKIYWQYRENRAYINWRDDDTVSINGVTLNVPDETYDFRDNE